MDEVRGVMSGDDGKTWMVTLRLLTPTKGEVQPQRKRFPPFTRQLLLTHQDHRCTICGGPLSLHEAHVDHVIPLSAGGTDDFTNLQLVHMNCNLRKGRRRQPDKPDQGTLPWA